ncbi:DUF4347 domain-containing protein, partial [Massilia sp. Root335]|uniref:DUF4347 domain-containing protein n=1 Tax=Massilia sp. Root335 TaxID=1736517 RepID=UPI000A518CF1
MAADTIPFPQTQIAQRDIAFIDTSVSGYRAIVDGIRPGVDICLIDGAHDGLAQIAAALEGRNDVAAVHIFSHGESGALQLGSTRLSLDNMGDYAADLTVLRAAMAPGGDLMVYGCDVAAGDAGKAFVNALAHATGADVAASSNLTGSVLQHGDWVLDTQTGPIEAAVALGAAGQQAFAGVLAIGSENFDSMGLITNTSPNEMLAGNWKFTTAVATDMAVANSDPGEFAVYLNEDGPTGDRAVILNYNFSLGVTQYTMGSADGSNFQLSSFAIGQVGGAASSVVTITAYSNGVQVAGPQSVDLSTSNTYGDIAYTMVHDDGGGRAGSLSFDSAYADIDEIDFSFASDANLDIDDIVATPVSADTTGPVFSSATVNGSTLVMTYTDASALDATNVPGTGSFAVTAGGNAVTVDTAVVNASARTVTLTLHGPVANNQAVTVAYTDPSAGNDASAIQDALGNDAASLTATTVTNLTPDTTPPVFASASVDGTTLVLSYTEATTLDAAHGPLPGAFTVMAAGTPVPVSAVSVDAAGKTVTLTLSAAVLYSQAVTVAYGDPTGANDTNAIQDAAGNDAASLSATSVTNNTADTTPPSVSGNIGVPANGTYVAGQTLNFTVTFDENVVVTGTDSTLGLTIGGTGRSATF